MEFNQDDKQNIISIVNDMMKDEDMDIAVSTNQEGKHFVAVVGRFATNYAELIAAAGEFCHSMDGFKPINPADFLRDAAAAFRKAAADGITETPKVGVFRANDDQTVN